MSRHSNSKQVLDAIIEFSEAPSVSRRKDGQADSEATPAPLAKDEPIRPFVYRAPSGKAAQSEPTHPLRRRSDIESRGN